MADTDYYEVLGVGRDATAAQIRSAYRKAALRTHPDVSGSPDGGEEFKHVTAVYDVLRDPEKREAYNRQAPNAGRGTKTAADPQKPDNPMLQKMEPEDGFVWAMRELRGAYPSLWGDAELKHAWRTRAEVYWAHAGRDYCRSRYLMASEEAAGIVFNERCIPAGNGVGPVQGFEWAMRKAKMDFWMIWRKPEWRERWRIEAEGAWLFSIVYMFRQQAASWQAEAEKYWLSSARDRDRYSYWTPTVQAGRLIYARFDDERNKRWRAWWARK